MKKNEAVKAWRRNTKARIVKSMGGACAICSYSACDDAFDLHHLDPSKKDFSFGGIRANPKAWSKIVTELRKCVLLCCRCHREVHAGVAWVPFDAAQFDEAYVDYRELERDYVQRSGPARTFCPVCGNSKHPANITCSLACAGKRARRVDWDSVDLEALLQEHSFVYIADQLGISDAAVHKRLKKIKAAREQGETGSGGTT